MLLRQRDLHPDKFAQAGEGAIELAKEVSGRVNGAYAVLGEPLRRAEYVVSLCLLANRLLYILKNAITGGECRQQNEWRLRRSGTNVGGITRPQ